MSEVHRDQYLKHQDENALAFRRQVLNKLLFSIFLMRKLPMAWMAGVRIKAIDGERCAVGVPFRWLNQNPFRSTYFAVLSMAAEMSIGLAVLMYCHRSQPSISTLVVSVRGEFIKKATGLTTFIFQDVKTVRDAVGSCLLTGEAQTITCTAKGYSTDNELEAIFHVTWSVKAKI